MNHDNSYVNADSRDAELLAIIAGDEGYESIDQLVEDQALRSVQYGICADPECEATTSRVEPDQDAGWCHACGGQQVKSVGILSGMC